MRNTTKDSEVLVVIGGKSHKGTITEVISQGAARIQLGDKSTIQASYSPTGEEGTYHYQDEAKAAKESDTFGEPPAAAQEQPDAADDKKAGKGKK